MALDAFSVLSARNAAADPNITLDRKNNPAFEETKCLARFKLRGVDYMVKSRIARPPKQMARERHWDFGEALVRVEDSVDVYYCWECERDGRQQALPILNGNTGGLAHMKSAHNRDPKTGVKQAKANAAPAIYHDLVHVRDYEVFKRLLIHWFVFCQMAFFMLENVFFRSLITYLNKSLGALLPRASSTLRAWILVEYERQKKLLIAELAERQSKVHLAFDIWTAGSYIGIISVWAYWIDTAGKRQRRLLAFRRIYGSHSGENQAEVLLEVIQEFKLTDGRYGVGYFVSDNHGANDSAVRLVLKRIYPAFTAEVVLGRSLRCFGHIVNLAAQSMLAASDAETKKAQMDLGIDDGEFKKRGKYWIQSGPLGKVHLLVKYVLASSQRREGFACILGGRDVVEYDKIGVSARGSCEVRSSAQRLPC